MAIVNCPACSKRISSVAKKCQYCDTVFDQAIDNEQLLRAARNKRIIKLQRLQNFSFLLVMLFAAGALVMYFGLTDQNQSLNYSGRAMLAVGFVGYVVARIMLFMTRRK